MSVKEELKNGSFAAKGYYEDSEGYKWFYKYNQANGVAILCPEEIIFVEQTEESACVQCNGIKVRSVKPAVAPIPHDVLKIPEFVNGFRVVGVDDFAFFKTATQAFSWPPQRVYTKVNIHSSIQYIGVAAFQGCDAITDISEGLAAETIGASAFSGCKKLEGVSFKPGTKTIGRFAFFDCKDLRWIVFSKGITTIDECAFANCHLLSQIDLPDSIESVALDAFSGSHCRITYPEKLGFAVPSVRWRMRTNNPIKKFCFNLLNRESLFSASRYQ